jgi:hypothetical protein
VTDLPVDTVPAWVDPDQVLTDVLDVLRKPVTDVDADRVEQLIPTAADLVRAYLDRDDDPLPPAPPMHPLVRTAMTNLTIELYRRKDAPFGVLNAWSPDEMAVRISSDPMRGVIHVLLPLKQQFGIG